MLYRRPNNWTLRYVVHLKNGKKGGAALFAAGAISSPQRVYLVKAIWRAWVQDFVTKSSVSGASGYQLRGLSHYSTSSFAGSGYPSPYLGRQATRLFLRTRQWITQGPSEPKRSPPSSETSLA